MTLHDLSKKIANKLAFKAGEPEKAPVLAYGFELLIGESLKMIILVLTAYSFDLLIPTVLFMSTYVPLRLLTGGQHCSSNLRCLIATLLIFLPLSLLAFHLSFMFDQIYLIFFAFVSSILFVHIIEKYGPGFSINYTDSLLKITNSIIKYCFLFLTLWLVIILILSYFMSNTELYSLILVSTTIGVLWQGFLVTPIGHRFIKGIDAGLLLLKIR